MFSPGKFDELMLPGWWYGAVEYQYPPHLRQGSYEEEGRSINFMKAGITTADRVVTVSPGYAEEIQTCVCSVADGICMHPTTGGVMLCLRFSHIVRSLVAGR